ncbi:MAG: thioredoxin domain-containing protein, partial [Acidobacteriota bacterium]
MKEGRNRLGQEKSPYLLQHQENPVWWWAWGEEPFAAALERDVPVFLSIGYSTCHWCHVMEHESFEDEDVARFLNEFFVCIKVDREERPDIDAIYMDAVQAMTGHGGWPMSVFLTPDRRPFFGGTYFPKQRFLALLQRIVDLWRHQREQTDKQGEALASMVARQSEQQTAGSIEPEVLHRFVQSWERRFDRTYGGRFGRPKFPPASEL